MSEKQKGYIVESFTLPKGLSPETETTIMLLAHHALSKGEMLNLCRENRGVNNPLLQEFEFTLLKDATSAPKNPVHKIYQPRWDEPTSPYVKKGKYHSDWPANKDSNSLLSYALQNTTEPHNFSPQGDDQANGIHERTREESVVLGDGGVAD